MDIKDNQRLAFHLQQVLEGRRRFENAAQSVSRMILASPVDKVPRSGESTYDYQFFRQGGKHIVGWYDELNDFTNFVKDAAQGGLAKEMAYVAIGEPGNGKTFFVDYVCSYYRRFLSLPQNTRFTFEFVGLDALGMYGDIHVAPSQTFEDPVVLAMNLYGSLDESKAYFSRVGFSDAAVDGLFGARYRPLGACSEYIWNDIRTQCNGDMEKMLGFVRVVPIRIAESLGTVTGKYSARDRITSSAADLLGEEDLSRLLNLSDTANPYRYNLRKGAVARVAGGGIHFSDEIFKNKADLVQIYLQVIQNRTIELDGSKWPIDCLIIATSNNEEYNDFVRQKGEGPVKDRCHICYVSHNTDYKLQQTLTRYAIGAEDKTSVTGDPIHEDPNLVYALSVAVALTRLVHSDKLTPVETMKLEAGEVAGEKSVKTLAELKAALNANQDVTKRWGQKGIGHRGLGRVVQNMLTMPKTHEGKCLVALDCFAAAEREILDYVLEAVDRDKYFKDLKTARRLYRTMIKTSIFNAYRDDADAIRKDVMAYINMVIGMDAEDLGPDKIWRYRDPQKPGHLKPIKIDERYIKAVEARLGLSSQERVAAFRTRIRMIYGQKRETNPNYDFMDNEDLVKAVTEVKLESDVAGAASLVAALANRTNDESVRIRHKMIDTMIGQLGYCPTCAEKTIEYYCTKEDES